MNRLLSTLAAIVALAFTVTSLQARADGDGGAQSQQDDIGPKIIVSRTNWKAQMGFIDIQIRAAEAQLKVAQISYNFVMDFQSQKLVQMCESKPTAAGCEKATEIILKAIPIMDENARKAEDNITAVEARYNRDLRLYGDDSEIAAYNSTVHHINWRKIRDNNRRASNSSQTVGLGLLGTVLAEGNGEKADAQAQSQYNMISNMMKIHTAFAVRDAKAEVEWYKGLNQAIANFVTKNYGEKVATK